MNVRLRRRRSLEGEQKAAARRYPRISSAADIHGE